MTFSRHSRDPPRVALVNSISSSIVLLRLLGSASVEGPEGPLAGRGVRGRRLALLAILATARGRPIGRDRLLAILWPETDTDRARPLLSDSLYLVRGGLGEDVIVTNGDEVRLNAERVTSDVETFERLIGEAQYERAIGEYGGPFLDGFHVSDAPEFERWVDGERSRLAARLADALGSLATARESEGDWPAAVEWLRRLATHDPCSGRIAIRLMRALHASGSRAAALQHARVHAALVREEFGVEPDAEVSAFVELLKSETAPAVASLARLSLAATPPPSSSSAPVPVTTAPAPGRTDTPGRWHATRARVTALVIGLAAVVTAVVLLESVDRERTSDSPPRPSALAPQRSIAVLPFANLGPPNETSYFSDGLTEEIIGLLGGVNGLHVAARTSSFAMRDAGLEARRLGDTLHVATLLEGSVRQEGDRILVTAQLINVADGYQLWSERYDRRVADVIALQNDIATSIVHALQLRLVSGDPETRTAHNPEAYDLYLRGVYARNKLTREGLSSAVDFFDRAIRLDSSYAPAYAGKATTVGPMVWHGHLPRAQGLPLMAAAARRAVELDEALPEAHIALGMTAFFFEWDWAGAERAFRRAMVLNPNEPHAHHFMANYLRATGRFDEAIAARRRAVELDPLSVRMGMVLGADYFVAGELDSAATYFRRASELEPRSPVVLGLGPGIHMGLGHVFELRGDSLAAITEYLRVDSLAGATPEELSRRHAAFASSGIRGYWRRRAEVMERDGASADPVHLAWMWARAGERERTIQNLTRAYREHSVALVYLGVMSDFDAVRGDPRVQEILASMGLRR